MLHYNQLNASYDHYGQKWNYGHNAFYGHQSLKPGACVIKFRYVMTNYGKKLSSEK